MSQDQWNEIDKYFSDLILKQDNILENTLKTSTDAGLPEIAVAPLHGKFLHLMVKIKGARNILEIGTLGGYSTIWMARALTSGGKLTTLEADPRNADIARQNIEAAGLTDKVDIRIGSALESLLILEQENAGPFDLIFLDADKVNNPNYLQWSLKLSRPGSIIICDNVVRDGEVLQKNSDDENVLGIRQFNELVAANPRLEATALQTVGIKGYDGFMIAVVTGVSS